MRYLVFLATLLHAIPSFAAANNGFVSDPEQCEAQWGVRLADHRNRHGNEEGWPEQLILDANIAGDFKMAQRYMEQFGWYAAATKDRDDLTLYFMPDTSQEPSSSLFMQRPVAIPSEGLKRACYAAWISGVPFTRVTRRGEDGQGVLYTVTTENMPVNDF